MFHNYTQYGYVVSPKEDSYETIISSMAATYGVDERFIKAVIQTESSWDTGARRSEPKINDASVGLMQVLLKTGRSILNNPNMTEAQLATPYTNIQAGTAYYAQQLKKYGNPIDAYAAYNAGAVYRNDDGTYVNQSNVNHFIKWYNLYTGSAVPTAITKETKLALNIGGIVAVGAILVMVAFWPTSERYKAETALQPI